VATYITYRVRHIFA